MKFYKQIISKILILSIILTNIPINTIFGENLSNQITIDTNDNESEQKVENKNEEALKENFKSETANNKSIVVGNITIDKTEATVGDKIKISVDISSENKITYGRISYRKPNGHSHYLDLNYNSKNSLFEGEIEITKYLQSGIWQFEQLSIDDNSGNSITIYNNNIDYNKKEWSDEYRDLSHLSFNVTGTVEDKEIPQFNRISVDKEIVTVDESITISVDASDNEGIDSIRVEYVDENGSWINDYYLNFNSETGKYESNIDINRYSRSGKYIPSYIYITDVAGNTLSIRNINNTYNKSYEKTQKNLYEYIELDLSKGIFEVENEFDKAPVVGDITIDKNSVTAGEKVKISAEITHNTEINYAYIEYKIPNSDENRSFDIRYNSSNGKYETEIEIGKYTNPGVWKVSNLYVRDNYGNSTNISNSNLNVNNREYKYEQRDLSHLDFNVTGTIEDKEMPIFNGISVDKEKVTIDESITISVDASDNEGINSIEVGYMNENEQYINYYDLEYNSETEKYESSININRYFTGGKYIPRYIYITDVAGNRLTVANINSGYSKSNEKIQKNIYEYIEVDLSEGIFEVYKEFDKAPEVGDITIDKNSVTAGEKVKISAEITHNTEINYAYIEYKIPNLDEDRIFDLRYNSSNGKYETEIEIGKYTNPGLWKVSRLYLNDNYGNSTNIYNNNLNVNNREYKYEERELSHLDFNVIGTIEDKEVPTFNDISVDKKKVTIYESVKLSVDASDNEEIDSIRVEYEDENGNWIGDYNLNYNSQTRKYEYDVNIYRHSRSGKYIPRYMQITDGAGNTLEVRNINSTYNKIDEKSQKSLYEYMEVDLSQGIFEVYKEFDKAPVIDYITIDKNSVTAGETVKISADIKHDYRVDFVNVWYKTPNPNMSRGYNLEYNPSNNRYETEIEIDKYTDPGLWQLESIGAEDEYGNTTQIYNSELTLTNREYVTETKDLSHLNFSVIGTINDNEVPTFNGISVDKNRVTVDDSVTISIDASDNEEITSIRVEYRDEYGNWIDSYNLEYNSKTKKYESTNNINKYSKTGKYIPQYIQITDGAGNTLEIRNTNNVYNKNDEKNQKYVYEYIELDLSNGIFEVYKDDEDVPVLNSIKIDKNKATIGDTVKISADISDKSKLDCVNVSYSPQDSTYYGEGIDLIYNEKTKLYEGELKIEKYMSSGIWKIYDINAEDKYGNCLSVYNNNIYNKNNLKSYSHEYRDLSNCDIQVYKEDEDAPILNSIKIDKNKVTIGDTVKISADISDKSKLDYVNVSYATWLDEEDGIGESIDLIYNEQTKLYEGELIIHKDMPSGIWKISSISAEDIYGNYLNVYNESRYDKSKLKSNSYEYRDLSNCNLEVYRDDEDAPVLNSIKIDKNKATIGDAVKISADISDKSKLDYVNVSYSSPDWSYSDEDIELIYNEKTKLYEGEFKVGKYVPSGVWKIYDISAEDKYGNRMYIENESIYDANKLKSYSYESRDLSNCNIEVIDTLEDNEAPKLNSIEVDRKKAASGDTVKVSVDATDNDEIQYIELVYSNDKSDDAEYVYLSLNEETGLYEGSIRIYDYMKSSTMKVFDMNIYDKSGNYLRVINSNVEHSTPDQYETFLITDLSDADFEVVTNCEDEDFNLDGVIDILDLAIIGQSYNKTEYEDGFSNRLDLNDDYIIDLFDLILLSKKIN